MSRRTWLALFVVAALAAGGGFALGRTTSPSGSSTDERALARLDAAELQATTGLHVLQLHRVAPRHWRVMLGNGCVAIDLDHFYIDSKTRYGGIARVTC